MAATMSPWARSRRVLAAIALSALAVSACSGDSHQPAATAAPRPVAVPESAEPVERDMSFGQIRRLPGGTAEAQDAPRILSIACDDDVVTVKTSGPTIYAAVPCDRFPPQVASVVDQLASISLQINPRKLFIQSEGGHQVEFSPGGLWLGGSP